MSAHCCEHHNPDPRGDPARQAIYRRVLWAALAINFGMFCVEIFASFAAGSAALQADAMDFLGDSANYAISLIVVGLALRYRATAALIKGGRPRSVGSGHDCLAPCPCNGAVFALLWAHRAGDANMRSVWLCSRKDVLGNLAVLLAAFGVFGTNQGCPDIAVALVMAALGLQGAWTVTKQARAELRSVRRLQTSPAE